MKRTSRIIIKLLAVILLFFTTTMPNVSAESSKDLGDIFSNIVLMKGEDIITQNSTVSVDQDTKLTMTLDWALEDGVELKNGDYATLPLNESVRLVTSKGPLKAVVDGQEVEVGEYSILDGSLQLIFNEVLEGKKNRHGDVGFLFEFNLNEFDDNLESELKIQGDPITNYYFIYNPKEGKTISKKGNVNGKFIDYSVDINTSFENLINVNFSDKIPTGLSLVADSVKVVKLNYDINDKVYTEGNDITSKLKVNTDNKFDIEFGDIKSAYRITYRTKIEEYPEEGYENKAILSSDNQKDVESIFPIDKIKEESIIEKKGELNHKNNPKKVTWTIDVNKAEATLNNVVILDDIPEGLIFESLKVYNLDYKEKNGKFDWVQGEQTEIFGEQFPLEVDTINSAYRVVVETKIDPNKIDFSADKIEKIYLNNVELVADGGYKEEASDEVIANWDNLVIKTGKDVTNYGDRTMEWTIELNKSKFNITGAKFVDIIGPGQEFIEGSIRVNGKSLSTSGYSLEENRETIMKDWNLDFSNIEVQDSEKVFGINLGKIDDTIKITYRTKIMPKIVDGLEVYESNYTNRALLFGWFGDGDGPGNGASNSIPVLEKHKTEGKLNVKNMFSKNKLGVDYKEKTFGWELKAEAQASPFTQLSIVDDFCDQSMKLANDTIKVFKEEITINNDGTIKKNKTELKENEDNGYTLNQENNCKFTVNFNIDKNNSVRTNYSVTFKTSFDPKILGINGWPAANKYENNVNFNGENTEDKFTENRKAEYELDKDIFNHGVKKATLDRDNRKISWSVNANALSYQFLDEFVITDTLSKGQSILKDTMKVYKYELSKDGDILNKTELVSVPKIVYDEKEDIVAGFVATFTDGLSHPVIFEFDTEILGISTNKYSNEAIITSNDYTKVYPADVIYKDHNKFVDKNSDVNGKTVYTDSEINWNVKINQSLSHIKEAIFKDNISAGLILVNDSIRVNGLAIAEKDIIISGSHKDQTTLQINLGEIKEIQYITYTTVVVANTGIVSNEATLYSNEQQLGESSSKTYNATVASWGSGTGESQGNIEIQKVNENYEIISNNEATFKLYYYINNDKILVGGKEHSTINGKLQFAKLPYRTYYLEEVKSPQGFNLDATVKEIVLDDKNIEYYFVNEHIKTDIEANKVWVHGPKIKPTVHFELHRHVEGQDSIKVEEAEIKTLTNGTESVLWEKLNKTDIAGNDYIYTVKEVDESGNELILDEYTKIEDGLTVTNTYVSLTTEIKAHKEWVNGPKDKPTVYFKLYRQVEDGKLESVDVEILEVDNDSLEVVWEKLDETDINGNKYTYIVKEVDEEGNDFSPKNYAKNEDGLKITNTYVSPKTEVVGKKIWIDGPENDRPTIELQLYRDGQAHLEPVTLENGENEYTWTELDLTDSKGKAYSYSVDEVKTPENYGKFISEDGLTITNVYNSPTTDVIGRKVWINGPEIKPTIELQLYRNNQKLGDPVIFIDGTYQYVWKDLDITDKQGVDYKYTVKEVETPKNYQKLEVGLMVTNTYISPKTEVVGTKVWVDGPKLKPEITLQLMRNNEEFGDLVTLTSGETSYTWHDLDLNDREGQKYTYAIKEVNVPKNYIASYSEDNLTVTNTYVIPKIQVIGKKVWIGGPEIKPSIQLQLYKNGEKLDDPVTLDNGNLEYFWPDLDATDIEGNSIEYTINEVDVPKNYEMTISKDKLTITNTYYSQKPGIPETGIKDNSLFYGLAIFGSSVMLISLKRRRKSHIN